MVLPSIGQPVCDSVTEDEQDHLSPVHNGSARPMTADMAIGPKYRPSSERPDCGFMRNNSSAAMIRQPCQTGKRLPLASRSRAFPISRPSIEIVSPLLQTVCPDNANTCLSMGTP